MFDLITAWSVIVKVPLANACVLVIILLFIIMGKSIFSHEPMHSGLKIHLQCK